ncbi:hydroxycinnamoyl-CoA:piscidic acid hydroxycinnamoyltransferase-like [Gastrolobium bilobum]|uniref:hydroxycinnamoyl-CoA:piscidic acid hydroxycinnamoyltransferase-like n=1 Tax=Gastrolobium bilobum TaxID=150636 RepID=UPI002AB03934|nr:hydroxycinnamoyl-CoA:piscidic acid hydroxycinnamoyltransferase-like [Gastrolobium bilobum]
MVKIHSSYPVIPSESTPTPNLSLSQCDQIKLPTHGSQLYVYTNNNTCNISDDSPLRTIRTSLSKALTHYYPMAGRLCWIQGGRLQLLCNTKGALFFEATCDDEVSLNDSGDFVPTHVVEQLVPKVDYGVPIEDIPLLLVQLTMFPCGGFTLGLALCRAVLDGASVGSFINSWAKLARKESLDSSLIPLLDRTLLDSRKLNMSPRFEHHEFFPPPLWAGMLKNTKMRLYPTTTTAMLKLTKGQVEKLKKACDFTQVKPYTSFEVISGHLWRCVCKVRYEGNWDQPTRLTTLVNCRNRLNPPLPHAYFGNATFPTVTPTCSFDDIVHKPLSYVVGKVRVAIERMSDEYVRSSLDYMANQKDLNLFRDIFYNSAGSVGGQFSGDPNLYVVGWTNFPFYSTDFGLGKPAYMVPGNINSEGKAFLLNNGNGDGFIVAVCLQPSHIDALKKLFYEGMEPSSKL